MGRRSRKRRDPAREAPARAPAPPRDALRRGYARGEARNEQIRQSLEPLAPGERPQAVTIAAVVAALLGLANLALLVGGVEVRGEEPGAPGVIGFALIMFMAAWGMWHAKYWAVLGFQALLLISILIAFLSLAVAGNIAAAVLCVAVLVGAGWLFYNLIRAMARLQMPVR